MPVSKRITCWAQTRLKCYSQVVKQKKALGYSFANEVLVDQPYRWDPAIQKCITDIIEDHNPSLAVRAVNSKYPLDADEECTKAQNLVLASENALEAQIRKWQKINSHTLLVLMPWLVPKAREDKSPVFVRLLSPG